MYIFWYFFSLFLYILGFFFKFMYENFDFFKCRYIYLHFVCFFYIFFSFNLGILPARSVGQNGGPELVSQFPQPWARDVGRRSADVPQTRRHSSSGHQCGGAVVFAGQTTVPAPFSTHGSLLLDWTLSLGELYHYGGPLDVDEW